MGGLSFTVTHFGKPRLPFVQAGITHFKKKIRPYASIDMTAIREEPFRKGTSVESYRKKDLERIKKIMNKRYAWVVLDEKGKSFSSSQFATFLEKWMQQGRSRIAFLVGGPHGLAPEILEEADLVLAVSEMTFSHEMILLILLEQIYRSLAIIHRHPYPK